MNRNCLLPIVGALLLAAASVSAATTRVIWHGHATFEIVTPKGAVLMIDPWLTNPKNPAKAAGEDPLEAVTRVDYILLTHGHRDHIGDAAALAQRHGARLVAQPELGRQMAKLMGYPGKQMGFDTLMNIGGTIAVADGEVRITMTDARHSGGMDNPFADKADEAAASVYAGTPAGFLIRIDGGPTLYHSGDTAYFGDMALIGEARPDLALICAGDHFTMGPAEAARAAKTLNAATAVPMHWGTFPVLAQEMAAFEASAKALDVNVRVIAPGETLEFDGVRLQ